jgi:hypothetical protein
MSQLAKRFFFFSRRGIFADAAAMPCLEISRSAQDASQSVGSRFRLRLHGGLLASN